MKITEKITEVLCAETTRGRVALISLIVVLSLAATLIMSHRDQKNREWLISRARIETVQNVEVTEGQSFALTTVKTTAGGTYVHLEKFSGPVSYLGSLATELKPGDRVWVSEGVYLANANDEWGKEVASKKK